MTYPLKLLKIPWRTIALTTEKSPELAGEKPRMTPTAWFAIGAAIATITGTLATYVITPIANLSIQIRDLKSADAAHEKMDIAQDAAIRALEQSTQASNDKLARIETKLDLILGERRIGDK